MPAKTRELLHQNAFAFCVHREAALL